MAEKNTLLMNAGPRLKPVSNKTPGPPGQVGNKRWGRLIEKIRYFNSVNRNRKHKVIF